MPESIRVARPFATPTPRPEQRPLSSSATAANPAPFAAVARVLPLTEELRVRHDRLARMVGAPVREVGVIVGNPDHEAGGLHRPPPQPCEPNHVPAPRRRSRWR